MARHSDPRKKENLLKSAVELFTEKGYDNSTIDAIAKKAGLTASNAYIYYKDKEDLLLAAVQTMMKEHSDTFEAISKNSIGMDNEQFVDNCFDELEKIRPRILFIIRCYLNPKLTHVFKDIDLDYSEVFTPYLEDFPVQKKKQIKRSLMALSDSFFLVGDKEKVKEAAILLLEEGRN